MDWHKSFLITGTDVENFVLIFILFWLFVLEDEVPNVAVLAFHANNPDQLKCHNKSDIPRE